MLLTQPSTVRVPLSILLQMEILGWFALILRCGGCVGKNLGPDWIILMALRGDREKLGTHVVYVSPPPLGVGVSCHGF